MRLKLSPESGYGSFNRGVVAPKPRGGLIGMPPRPQRTRPRISKRSSTGKTAMAVLVLAMCGLFASSSWSGAPRAISLIAKIPESKAATATMKAAPSKIAALKTGVTASAPKPVTSLAAHGGDHAPAPGAGAHDDDHGTSPLASGLALGVHGNDDGHGDHGDGDHGDGDHAAHGNHNIFLLGTDLNAPLVVICTCTLVAFTVIFEFFLRVVEEYLAASPHYAEMLGKVMSELAILGFVSFGVVVAECAGLFEGQTQVLLSLEFAHISLFFFALLFVIQALVIANVTVPIKRWWRAIANLTMDQFLEKAGRRSSFTSQYVLSYRKIRCLFLKRNNLKSNFNFALYLEKSLDFQAVDLMEVRIEAWLCLLGLLGTFLWLYKQGIATQPFRCALYFGYSMLLFAMVLVVLTQMTIRDLVEDTGLTEQRGPDGRLKKGSLSWWDNPSSTIVANTWLMPPSYCKFGMDILSMSNAAYLSYFFCNLMMSDASPATNKDPNVNYMDPALFITLCPLPSLIVVFIFTPWLIHDYSVLMSIVGTDEEIYEEVRAYMDKEKELVGEVRRKLAGLDVDKLFSEFDLDRSGFIDEIEFKQGLAEVQIFYGQADFTKVMRVVDPDQSGQISKQELRDFLKSRPGP
jgi:Ca2+-binding EF-hand superfamily protein